MKPFLRFWAACLSLIYIFYATPVAVTCFAEVDADPLAAETVSIPETTEVSEPAASETQPAEETGGDAAVQSEEPAFYEEFSFFADSADSAQEIAAAASADLISYRYGIGTIRVGKLYANQQVALPENIKLYPEHEYTVEQTGGSASCATKSEGNGLDQWHLPLLHAQEAWEISTGKNVLVAVIDTGIDIAHEDLTGAVVAAETTIPADYYGKDSMFPEEYRGYMDNLGHGTHVTGIVGARKNGYGCTGIAPECSILSIKALERSGSQGKGKSSWVAAAVAMAVERGADVINLSVGGTVVKDELLMCSIQKALDAGVFVVCAAGNVQTPVVMYPGAYEGTLAVSALKQQGDSVTFASGYSNSGDWIDFSAPGSNILSTVPGGYEKKTGTSMACPMVSGALALMLSVDPYLTTEQIHELLQYTVQDLGDPGKDTRYGHGMPNLAAMLKSYQEQILPDEPDSDIPSGSTLFFGTPISITTNTLHGKVVYTTDGTEPSGDSDVWPETPVRFPEGTNEVTIIARTVGKDGSLGSSVSYTYYFIPALTVLTERSGVISGVIPIYGDGLDPVLKRLCRRYQLQLPSGQEFRIAEPPKNGDFSVVLLDGSGEDAEVLKPVRKQGELLWQNETGEEQILYLSVVLAENLSPTEDVSYSLRFRIQDIPKETPEGTKPTKPVTPPVTQPVTEPTEAPVEEPTELPTEPSVDAAEQEIPETVFQDFEEDWLYAMEEETEPEEIAPSVPEEGEDMPVGRIDYSFLLAGGIIMLFGIGLLLLGYFTGKKPWLLIRNGVPTSATVSRISRCMDRQTYQYQLTYRTRGGQQITAFWDVYKRRQYTRRHPEGSTMKVKYLPESPRKFIVVNDHTAILCSACCIVTGIGVMLLAIWIVSFMFVS